MNRREKHSDDFTERPVSTTEVKHHLPLAAEDMNTIRHDLYAITDDLETRFVQPQATETSHYGYCDNRGTQLNTRASYNYATLADGEVWFKTPDDTVILYSYRTKDNSNSDDATWEKNEAAPGKKSASTRLTTDQVVNELSVLIKESPCISRLTDAVFNRPHHVFESLDDTARELELQTYTTETYTHSDAAMHSENILFSERRMALQKHSVNGRRHAIGLFIESDLLSPSEGVPLTDTAQRIAFNYTEEKYSDDTGTADIILKTHNPTVQREQLNEILRLYTNPQQSYYFRETIVNAAKEISRWQLSELLD